MVATTTDGSKIVKTSIDIIETALMKNKMTDASAMAKAIADSGTIALFGIYFDSGKAVASNHSEEGSAKNRRVQWVEQSR